MTKLKRTLKECLAQSLISTSLLAMTACLDLSMEPDLDVESVDQMSEIPSPSSTPGLDAAPDALDASDAPDASPSPSPSAPPPASATPAPTLTKVTTNNIPKSFAVLAAEAFTTSPTKPTQITDLGTLTATALPTNPAVGTYTSSMGGTCAKVSDAPAGHLVGSSGAEGCIVAVIVQCDGTVYACHFTAGDDPVATLKKLGPFPACSHAAIAGGTNEPASNDTLASVIAALQANEVTIDGMLDRIGVYWDADNNRWVYGPLEKRSQNR